MPCLKGAYDRRVGPLVNILVVPAASLAPHTNGTSHPKPPEQQQGFSCGALLDTGAANTCIGRQVAEQLHLRSLGLRPIAGVPEGHPANTYLVDLIIPFGATGFVIQNLNVYEITTQPAWPFQALLGRDVIGRGVLTMSFDDQFTFSL